MAALMQVLGNRGMTTALLTRARCLPTVPRLCRCVARRSSNSGSVSVAEAQAEEYDALSSKQLEGGQILLELFKTKVASSTKANRVILDLGCGTGTLTPLLSEFAGEGGRVIGVDPDEERLKVAREKFEGKLSNVEFLTGSGEDFPEGPYDLVFSNAVIHWIENKALVFKKVYEKLRHGGHFAFNVMIDIEAPELQEVITLFREESGLHTMPYDFYVKQATSHNFTVTHKEFARNQVSFPNLDYFFLFVFAISHGKFHPDKAESQVEKLKKRYGEKPFEIAATFGRFLLTKPDLHSKL